MSQLRTLVKKLQGATSDPDRLGLLNALKEEKISETILRESKAGLAVGKLRSHDNTNISALAKELVKKWKDDIAAEKATRPAAASSQASTSSATATPAKIKTNAPVRKNSATPAPATPSTPTTNGAVRTAKTDGTKVDGVTGDKTRDKCVELLYDAMASDSGSPSDLILKRAVAIEAAVLDAHGPGSSAAYKTRLRSLLVNLKDRANPGLRASVVSGDLPAARFAGMSSEDMASEERKAENARIQEENLFKTYAAGEREAETDQFQCGRCKQRKCRYRQAQTRSADEPMTTFVTCTNCGHRWKFS